MLSILWWIVVGALAGWIASMIMKTDAEQGAVGNVVVGVLGAVIGGFLFENVFNADSEGGFLYTLMVAVIGAVVLLAIVKAFRKR